MQVDLIYYVETGTVLSVVTRNAAVSDDSDIEAIVGDQLELRSMYSREISILAGSSTNPNLARFTVEANQDLETLLFSPWEFGVVDKALVRYNKAISLAWNAVEKRFVATMTPAAGDSAKVEFLVRLRTETRIEPGQPDATGAKFSSPSFDEASWGMVLAANYRTAFKYISE